MKSNVTLLVTIVIVHCLPNAYCFLPTDLYYLLRHQSTSPSSLLFQSVQHSDDIFMIHWKGEDVDGYSMQLRQIEFCGALSAVFGKDVDGILDFTDALEYNGAVHLPPVKLEQYESGMQYVSGLSKIPLDVLINAAERCSLLNSIYRIMAKQTNGTYDTLAALAVENGGFNDMHHGGSNQEATWAVRVRYYGEQEDANKERRFSARARSMKLERKALKALKPLLLQFGGKVDLENPDSKITIFDGMTPGMMILGRRLARGPRISTLNPNTRICVTNTPLNPIAAFCLNNVARIRPNMTVLDPYCGSAATLLAAAMIEPSCQTVGIEIAHNGLVNRDDIRRDFATRSLTQPVALIQGDSTNTTIINESLSAVAKQSFDVIVTDPPYGIRESSNYNELTPIEELFRTLGSFSRSGSPILKAGGRLVLFVPCNEDERIDDFLPSKDQALNAGLELELLREQPLNDILSRWLVSYQCTPIHS